MYMRADTTTIRVTPETKKILDDAKIVKQESYNDCILRITQVYNKHKDDDEKATKSIDDWIANLPYTPTPEKE